MRILARSDILPVREIEYRCDKCHRVDNRPNNFYRSNSQLYDNNGYMPICKDCLAKLYNQYLLNFHDIHKAIKRICMAYDLYYSENLFYYHDVAQGRLTNEQLEKLLHSFEMGKEISEKYHYAMQYSKSSTINHILWLFVRIFNYLTVSSQYRPRKRQLLHFHSCMCGIGKGDKEFDVIKGYINFISNIDPVHFSEK